MSASSQPAGAAAPAATSPGVSGSAKRLTLVATILGSSIAILDGSVVSVALPSIQRSLGGGLAGQQWVSNAYLLTLGSLILLGGSLGDIFGERRIFALGVGGFGATSLLCALALGKRADDECQRARRQQRAGDALERAKRDQQPDRRRERA